MEAALLLGFIVIYFETCFGDTRFSQVRRLSAQQYGEDYNLKHPLGKRTSTYPPRALFSWDTISDQPKHEKENSASKQLYDHRAAYKDSLVRNVNKRSEHKKQNGESNIWWPWKSYEDWVTSRRRNKDDKEIKIGKKQIEKDKKSAIKHNRRLNDKKNRRKRKKNTKKNNRNKKLITGLENEKHTLNLKMINFPRKIETQSRLSFLHEQPEITYKVDSGGTKEIKTVDRRRDLPLNTASENVDVFKAKEAEVTKSTNSQNSGLEKYYLNKNTSSIEVTPVEDSHQLKMFQYFKTFWKAPLLAIAGKNYTEDDNECLVNNGGCEGLCINTVASYRCHCPAGFRLSASGRKCLDVNECFARNGHGPCQGQCTNTWGSYRCSCDGTPGTKLADDGRSCTDIDECNDRGCSHSCINTIGSAFCACPEGYTLGSDWKTCHDVDECAMEDLQIVACSRSCENTIGSYNCL